MLFKILHGDASRISTDITPFHEGYCYVTYNGNMYVDMNVGTESSPNNKRMQINGMYNPTIQTITLPSSSWDTTLQQTVAVTGVSADQTAQIITISPDISYYVEYLDAGVQCIGQAENSLTFSVEEIPSSDFIVYIAVQNCK